MPNNTNHPRNPQSTSGTSTRPKGKSRYAGKSRGKKFVKSGKPLGPTFTYTSICCSAPANKPACTKASKVKGATPQALGTWRCTQCKKVCKVTVSKYKVPETVNAELVAIASNPEVSLG